MSNTSSNGGWRGLLAVALAIATLATPVVAGGAEKPYTEDTPKRGFHPFVRPKKSAPDAQWEYVQALDRENKTRAAAKQALALRFFWPNSEEASRAQMYYARRMEQRGRLQPAFDAYQYLVDHYTGRFEFNEVLDLQMQIAKTLMDQKKGRFLFFPGFDAPERAIPLFEKIVASAPESQHAVEAHFLIGAAHERAFEYAEAIEAYFTALNRFPRSEFAAKAAYALAACHIKSADDSPNDSRARNEAIAACSLFLQRQPDSEHRKEIENGIDRLQDQQVAAAFSRARYYDRIVRKPESALIEYRSFAALYPDAPQAAEARNRIAQLTPEEK